MVREELAIGRLSGTRAFGPSRYHSPRVTDSTKKTMKRMYPRVTDSTKKTMKRMYPQGHAIKREASQTWTLYLPDGKLVGTARRSGSKHWRVSPRGRQPAHRLFAHTLGDAIETAAKYIEYRGE